jgi:hypothetical protein
MSTPRLSLDVIQVAEPCHQPWEAMTGDDRVRFCEGCRKHVHNLSALTRTEAERLVCEAAGSLCVRFARGGDGTIQTLEYQPPPPRRRGWRFWTAVSTCAAALVAGVNGYLLAQGKPPVGAGVPAVTLGKIAAPPPVMGMVAPPVRPAPPAVPYTKPSPDQP